MLSLLAGWIVGVFFSWLGLPLSAPPPIELVGAAGIALGSWSLHYLRDLLTH